MQSISLIGTVVVEKKLFERFLPYMGMAAILNFRFYPTHSRLVYDPTGMILAIFNGEVPHMLPAKYQPNPPGGSGEEDF